MRSPIQFFAVMALALAAATVAAQVYKWVDKDGKVQYTDTPPPPTAAKGEAKKLNTGPAGAPPAAKPVAAKAKEPEKSKADATKTAQNEAAAQKNAALDEERCRGAKRHLAALDSGRPLANTNDAGERVIMSDEERAAETARARAAIAESCKN